MQHAGNALIFERFGEPVPEEIFILPFFVKGKPQAIIYTDNLKSEIFEKEIEILSKIGEMSLDLLPLRQKIMARVKTQKFLDHEEETLETSKDDIQTASNYFEKPETEVSPAQASAQRNARVTISDIILYNSEKVEEARNNHDIYNYLKDTIHTLLWFTAKSCKCRNLS